MIQPGIYKACLHGHGIEPCVCVCVCVCVHACVCMCISDTVCAPVCACASDNGISIISCIIYALAAWYKHTMACKIIDN